MSTLTQPADGTKPKASWRRPPTPLTYLVGRQAELAQGTELLASHRLVTLTGPGGSGKTRLAQQLVREVTGRFIDGISWVDLGRLTDPELIPSAIAEAVGAVEHPGQPLLDELITHLGMRSFLVVLDNCEHLAAACARVALALLPNTALTILATSREPLNIPGEQRYPVPPLALPPLDAPLIEIRQCAAVQLFADRAREVLPDFAVTAGNAAVVARICRRLDGLPLALELASALVNVLALEQIEARLVERFAGLVTQRPETEPRHRSLLAVMDSSYALLSAREQQLLQNLALCVGGCDLDLAEAVGLDDPEQRDALFNTLAALVDKSLVIVHRPAGGPARYRLLETVRAYVILAGRRSPEWLARCDRFLDYHVALAEAAAAQFSGRTQAQGLSRLDPEHDNLRAALAWAVEGARVEAGLRLANALASYWLVRGIWEESRLWLERLLAMPSDSVPLLVLVKACTAAAFVCGRSNDAPAARDYAQQAVSLAEAAGEAGRPALANALAGLALSAQAAGEHAVTEEILERALPLFRELDAPHLLGMALRVGGVAALALGRFEAARARLDEALELARAAGIPYWTALALNYSGDLARCEHDYAGARRRYTESLALLRPLGEGRDVAGVIHNLAHTELHLGEGECAAALFRESLRLQQAAENAAGIAEGLVGFAALAGAAGRPAAGVRLLAAAAALRPPAARRWPAEDREQQFYADRIRAALPAPEFESETSAGAALTAEQAIAEAFSLVWRTPATAPGGLTERERQVARLIAAGRSNGEIAAELVVSKRTVEKHMANVLSKLGLSSRAQVVRWALDNGLT